MLGCQTATCVGFTLGAGGGASVLGNIFTDKYIHVNSFMSASARLRSSSSLADGAMRLINVELGAVKARCDRKWIN